VAVSPVSAVPEVRSRLLELQRAVAAAGSIVVEGRDIGSVVLPEAPVKVYLTADPQARAARRALEDGSGDVQATQDSLLSRDAIDSTRAVAPLVQADGAAHLDTTAYSLDEVVDLVVALAQTARDPNPEGSDD
jgi:cytidylate kinase